MLIRVRSRDGNFRFEVQPDSDIAELVQKILETSPDADPNTLTISNQPRGNETPTSSLKGKTLQALGLKHGDMIFVGYQIREALPAPTLTAEGAPVAAAAAAAAAASTTSSTRPWHNVQEDAVDVYWRSKDGTIPRGRDSRFCKHGANAMCDYCMPLEPYDAKYHSENSIKHLSYHAYIRKLTPKSSTATSTELPPLSPLSYRVKVPCPSGHPSWPAAICTQCQPSAITLQSQNFRMVDHLEIASTDIIDRFLHAWRSTGLQRFGWLIGHYEPYDKVPMGIKAVVEAIHEPPQEGELDGLTLGLPWEDEPRIRGLAASASSPLSIVGYIFTDLDPTPEDRTKNVYKRHSGSYFLSSLETIFAAAIQNANPTPSRSSETGFYSSRMVTAVLTATEDGQVDISAFQVSEQACAMVAADMIEPSVDPGIVRVKEEDRTAGSARYVPDVFFRYKNEYGLEVKKSAKPAFPVEYLLVNVTHGFPQTQQPVFRSTTFPIENRPGLEDATIEKSMRELARLEAPDIHDSRQTSGGDSHRRIELARWISDWHFVAFMGTTQLISEDDMKVLIRTATAPDIESPTVLDQLISTPSWQTLMTFTRETHPPQRLGSSAPSAPTGMDVDDIPQELLDQFAAEDRGGGGAASTGAASSTNLRVCPHCTFENSHGGSDCEVCGLPLSG